VGIQKDVDREDNDSRTNALPNRVPVCASPVRDDHHGDELARDVYVQHICNETPSGVKVRALFAMPIKG